MKNTPGSIMQPLADELSRHAFAVGGREGAIPNKRTFYALWERGLLGNKPRSWKSLQELMSSGYCGNVHFRYAAPGSPYRLADVPYDDVEKAHRELIKKGAQPELIRLSESLPASHIVMHGNIQRSLQHFDLEYALKEDDARDARGMPRLCRFACGIVAKQLLQHFLCPNSLEDLTALLDSFPDSVIEFTVYDCRVGLLSDRNTVTWEVRNY